MIDRKMAASPVDGLIVYPEGKTSCKLATTFDASKRSIILSILYTE